MVWLYSCTARRPGSLTGGMIHGLVKGANGQGRPHITHIHRRVDRDWEYSISEKIRGPAEKDENS